MGRKGITYDQVAAAATSLEAERAGSVTLAAVRNRLGDTGSFNTIYKHLKAWEDVQPKKTAPSIAIPEEVARAMTGWVMQVTTAGRADSEERAVHAHAAAAELARVGGDLEAERDELQADIAALTTQRDQQQGMADERGAEIQRLLGEIERERDLAGVAVVDAAQAKLKVESQVEYLAETRARVDFLSAAIETERTARTVAERNAAVLTAQLDGARIELETTRAQVVMLQQELTAGRERFEVRVQQDQDLVDELREQHREEINALQGAADGARTAVVAEAAEKFKALSQLAIEQERSKAAVEKAQDALAAERARVAVLEQERANLQERLKAAEALAKDKAQGSYQS